MSSVGAFQPVPGSASYAASKAFVQSFSEAVHAELAGTGVSLTTLSPGATSTEFGEAAGTDLLDRVPSAFTATPAEVAEAGVAGMVAGRRRSSRAWSTRSARSAAASRRARCCCPR